MSKTFQLLKIFFKTKTFLNVYLITVRFCSDKLPHILRFWFTYIKIQMKGKSRILQKHRVCYPRSFLNSRLKLISLECIMSQEPP